MRDVLLAGKYPLCNKCSGPLSWCENWKKRKIGTKENQIMGLKQSILKGIIFVLLIVITIILDVFYIKVGKRLLWLICGYIAYWIWEVEED